MGSDSNEHTVPSKHIRDSDRLLLSVNRRNVDRCWLTESRKKKLTNNTMRDIIAVYYSLRVEMWNWMYFGLAPADLPTHTRTHTYTNPS